MNILAQLDFSNENFMQTRNLDKAKFWIIIVETIQRSFHKEFHANLLKLFS